ncbi:hypothetical protein DFH28DRAFT_628411 [Melampsora americana]|nr:hypothetical protein DFH28DRAFT_628411 [Melampsora americana]
MKMKGEKGKFKSNGFYDRAHLHVRNRSWSSTSISFHPSRHHWILDHYGFEHDPEHCQFRTVSPIRHHQHDQDQEGLENSESESESDEEEEDESSLSSSTSPAFFTSARLTHHDYCCSRHRDRSGSTSSSKLSTSDPLSFLPPPPTTSYPRSINLNSSSSRRPSLPPIRSLPDRNRAGSQSSSSKLSFEPTQRLSSLPSREKILSIHSIPDDRLSHSLTRPPSSNLKHFNTLHRSETHLNSSDPQHSILNSSVLVISNEDSIEQEGLENMPLTSLWLKNPLMFESSIIESKSNHLPFSSKAKTKFKSQRLEQSLLNFQLDFKIHLLRTRQRLSKVLKKS